VQAVLESGSCTIPKTVFIATPYNLAWGDSIQAKVIAVNIVGQSAESEVGNGALLRREPDAPFNLAKVTTSTSSSQITISWQEGLQNGGSSVLDYSVSYD